MVKCHSSRLNNRATTGCSERDESSVRRGESTGVDIEVRQVGVEVNMQRLAPGGTRSVGGSSNERRSDPLAADPFGNHHVLDPGVHEAVPDDVGEADESVIDSSGDPSETVVLDELIPVPFVVPIQAGAKRSSVELVDFLVRKPSAFPLPFHTDLRIMDQPGRTLVRTHHATGHQTQIFPSRKRSERIERYIAQNNINPVPFKWTATADSIFAKLARLAKVLCGTKH